MTTSRATAAEATDTRPAGERVHDLGPQQGPVTMAAGAAVIAGRRAAPRFSALADTADVTRRNLLNLVRTPQSLFFATAQPIMFILLFRYAFGGAIRMAPGTSYVDFLVPGVFAQSVAFGSMGTAIGLATDIKSGLVERFRTLPMSRMAILAGRTSADLIRGLVVVAAMVGVGFAVGFRVHTSATAFLAATGLIALFSYAMSWAFVLIGLRIGDPEAAATAGIPVIMVLTFASDAFVPIRSMPGWLQAFASRQPLTSLVEAVRALALGGPTAGHVTSALAWSGGILVVFAGLALRAYRRMNR